MIFTGSILIPAEQNKVFEKINDVKFFSSCIDGVGNLEEIDQYHYKAKFKTKIAYINMEFNIVVQILESISPDVITAKFEGTPLGIVGRISSTAKAILIGDGENTRLNYEIDMALTGKLGSMGQPVLRSKAKELEKEFVKRIQVEFA